MARPSFRKLAVVQVLLAVAGAATWFFVKTRAWLEIPPPPHADLYAHEWGFQLIVFALFWLPAVLIGVAVLLGVEYLLLWAYQRWQGAASIRHAP